MPTLHRIAAKLPLSQWIGEDFVSVGGAHPTLLFDFREFRGGPLDSLAREVYGSPRKGGIARDPLPS